MRARGRIATVLAAVLVLGLLIGRSQQSAIAFALFDRAVDERVGRTVANDLPDGLHVALCGTGSPLPSLARAGPCNVVIAGKRIFVVDIGEGGSRNINLMGIPPGQIEAVFLTHFHSDHIDGLGPLMLARWTAGTATVPLLVYGPAGVDRIVAGFNKAYEIDSSYRTAHHGPAIAPLSGAGGIAVPFALPESGQAQSVVVFENDGLKVTAVRVDHGPVKQAAGYRFDYGGRSVVISGDTTKSFALVAAAKGADLLVHEALQPKLVASMTASLEAKGLKSLGQITRDIVGYHTTPEQAAEVAEAAGVKKLVLSHIVPPIPSKFFYPAFLGDAASRFQGPIMVGEDGMLFSLPVGKTDIVKRRLM